MNFPTQRLQNSVLPTLTGVSVNDLPVLAFNDLNAPFVVGGYVIEGLQLTLPAGCSLPSPFDAELNPIQTNFLSIVTFTNTGVNDVLFIHNSGVCEPANKMFFIGLANVTLQPKESIQLHYKQVPSQTGWWHYQNI